VALLRLVSSHQPLQRNLHSTEAYTVLLALEGLPGGAVYIIARRCTTPWNNGRAGRRMPSLMGLFANSLSAKE
jgi:hypothetical protein